MRAAFTFSGAVGWAWAAIASLVVAPAAAEVVWHRSGLNARSGMAPPEMAEDSFQRASSKLNAPVIGLSLMDLLDAYFGKTIWLNAKPLTDCFMPGDSALSGQALSSLALSAATMRQMARQSAIVQSHLQLVTDEAAMRSCVARRFPAGGYLSQVTKNEWVAPCF